MAVLNRVFVSDDAFAISMRLKAFHFCRVLDARVLSWREVRCPGWICVWSIRSRVFVHCEVTHRFSRWRWSVRMCSGWLKNIARHRGAKAITSPIGRLRQRVSEWCADEKKQSVSVCVCRECVLQLLLDSFRRLFLYHSQTEKLILNWKFRGWKAFGRRRAHSALFVSGNKVVNIRYLYLYMWKECTRTRWTRYGLVEYSTFMRMYWAVPLCLCRTNSFCWITFRTEWKEMDPIEANTNTMITQNTIANQSMTHANGAERLSVRCALRKFVK